MRGMALKAAGAALLADVRAAVNTARRTANAAMREMDCIMVMRAIFVCFAAFKWRRSLPLPAACVAVVPHLNRTHTHIGPQPLHPLPIPANTRRRLGVRMQEQSGLDGWVKQPQPQPQPQHHHHHQQQQQQQQQQHRGPHEE